MVTAEAQAKPKSSFTKFEKPTSSATELLNNRHELHSQHGIPTIVHPNDGEEMSKRREKKPIKATFMEKVREFCAQADMFATSHVWPIHVLCILVATVIIPISAVAVVWDLLSAVVFEIPDLSTINTPAFVLFINFVAIPLAMYGYMMEYLLHEHSKLAIIALVCVIVHPILFAIRALVENVFDGYRGEEKIYFEAFARDGEEHKYPIGLVRYNQGSPFSDSEDGQLLIEQTFAKEHDSSP